MNNNYRDDIHPDAYINNLASESMYVNENDEIEEEKLQEIDEENDNKPRQTFAELINQFPPEFKLFAEEYCESHMKDTLDMINSYIGEDGKNLDVLEEHAKNYFFSLLEIAHNWGFYGGMEFTLAPEQKHQSKKIKISITKHERQGLN